MEDLFDNKDIKEEYERCITQFGEEDPYTSPDTVGLHEVLRAHYLIADYFFTKGEGIGGIGPKDPNLVHSAVYRQFVSFQGEDKWRTTFEKAATLLFGIICDHPFHDANKRTGLLVLLLSLRKMSRVPTIKHKQLEDFAVDIADQKLAKHSRFVQYKKRRRDPEILFIADFLKRYSRQVDRSKHKITYSQLNQILKNFGYSLTNPRKNFIDLVRIKERRRLFGFGEREQVNVKIAQIGFPGWKSQVNHGALSTVRKEAKLRTEDGFDSKTFYEGSDPIPALIAEYATPLDRLAYR